MFLRVSQDKTSQGSTRDVTTHPGSQTHGDGTDTLNPDHGPCHDVSGSERHPRSLNHGGAGTGDGGWTSRGGGTPGRVSVGGRVEGGGGAVDKRTSANTYCTRRAWSSCSATSSCYSRRSRCYRTGTRREEDPKKSQGSWCQWDNEVFVPTVTTPTTHCLVVPTGIPTRGGRLPRGVPYGQGRRAGGHLWDRCPWTTNGWVGRTPVYPGPLDHW